MGLIAGLIAYVLGGRVATGFYGLVGFFLMFFYYIVFEAGKWGASPGKKIMGLRVVDTSGAPLTLGQAFIRNMLRFADMMPIFGYGFGLTCTLLTKRFQRMGDLLANSVVVYERLPAMNAQRLPPVMKEVTPGLPLTKEERAAVIGFRERAAMWSEPRRVELANHASALSGKDGKEGMTRLLAMAHWLDEEAK